MSEAQSALDLPIRVALVSETYRPEINGVAMTLGRMVDALAARGHSIQVVRPRQPSDGEAGRQESHPGVEMLLRPGIAIPRYDGLRLGLPSAGALKRSWRERRPDIVHVATEGPLGASAIRAARSLHLPVSSSYHTNFDDYAAHYGIGPWRGLVAWWLKRLHNRTHLTMVPSSDLMARLGGNGYHNVGLFPRGVDIEKFHPAHRDESLRRSWGARPESLVCLVVGRVAPEKNLQLALRTWNVIRCQQPDARMLVVGDGPLRARLAADWPDAVFTGAISDAELVRVYASADMFLFPSQSETFGNVLLEAMASGLPAVAFDYAAANAHVRHGINGCTVPVGDETRWMSEAVALANDACCRARLGREARMTAAGIGWDVVVDGFVRLLRQVIARANLVADEGISPLHIAIPTKTESASHGRFHQEMCP